MTKIYFEDSDVYVEVPSPEEAKANKVIFDITNEVLGFSSGSADDTAEQ